MSKLRSSTFFWAFSNALLIHGWTKASPSGKPRRCRTLDIFSEPKIRIKSSSIDKKNFDVPGSPWRPERPRNWLSIRRLSWRSVPTIYKPPAAKTFSLSAATSFSICSFMEATNSGDSWPVSFSLSFISGLPPSWISVPRPAIFVAMVIAPETPACATMAASLSWWRAFNTSNLTSGAAWCSSSATISDFSTEVVPTRTGWPRRWQSNMVLIIALYFSFSVR